MAVVDKITGEILDAITAYYAGPSPIVKYCNKCAFGYQLRYNPQFKVGGGVIWTLEEDTHECKERPW